MNEIPVKTVCRSCQGGAYVPSEETFVLAGRIHHRFVRCASCEGTGKELRWVELEELVMMVRAIAAEEKQQVEGSKT